MADKNIGSLPAAEALDDESLLLTEQQGEARHFKGKLLKDYARQGVDALVSAAQEAATKAAQAAQDAQAAADGVKDVIADTEAAKAAAQAAENARAAAVQAAQAAEQAARLAADAAAIEAVQSVEDKLVGYVSDAESAKTAAQSAAGVAAQEAVSAVGPEMAGYVSAAQAAQRAAEQARDEAQGIAGGDFASTSYVDSKAKAAEDNAKAYTNEKFAAIPIPDVSEQIGTHNANTDAHGDIRLLITELTTRLNALANSEDVDLDQMAELVAYIKSNRTLIEQITTGKVSVSDIVNNLTTNVANKPLSAAQGVALKALADAASTAAANAKTTADSKQNKITGSAGQVVGFDASGNPVAQDAPNSGGGATAVSATLKASGWAQGDDGRYTQTVAVAGVTTDESQVIVVDVHLTGTDTAADNEALAAWGPDDGSGPSSNNIKQGNGTLTFYCTAVPSINIPLIVGVH